MARLKPTHGPLWHGASSCVNSHHFSSIVTTEWVRTAGVFRCKLPTFDNPLEHAYVARAWWKATGVHQRHPNEMPCHPVSDSSELRYTGRMSIWGQVEHQTILQLKLCHLEIYHFLFTRLWGCLLQSIEIRRGRFVLQHMLHARNAQKNTLLEFGTSGNSIFDRGRSA